MILNKNKGLGKDDNITYLLQKTNTGVKPKTKEEMLALQDEMNRQYKLLGVQTRAKYFADAENYNPKYLDHTDNTIVVGDAVAQEAYIKKKFPQGYSNIKGWGANAGPSNAGISDVGLNDSYGFTKGSYGMVDNRGANFVSSVSNNRISPLQALAALAIHEDTHPYYSKKHISKGIFEEGQSTINKIKNGMTIGEWVSPKKSGNKKYRNVIINTRQLGDADRVATDNYAENKRLTESKGFHDTFDPFTFSVKDPYVKLKMRKDAPYTYHNTTKPVPFYNPITGEA